jgi:hypothetical protein
VNRELDQWSSSGNSLNLGLDRADRVQWVRFRVQWYLNPEPDFYVVKKIKLQPQCSYNYCNIIPGRQGCPAPTCENISATVAPENREHTSQRCSLLSCCVLTLNGVDLAEHDSCSEGRRAMASRAALSADLRTDKSG